MKSSSRSDGAEAAFRLFVRLGLDKAENYFELAERAVGVCGAGAAEMLAVADTLRLLSCTGREAEAFAVREVYMRRVRGRLRAGDVSAAVQWTARALHCDERTVYRYLSSARALWRRLSDGYRRAGFPGRPRAGRG